MQDAGLHPFLAKKAILFDVDGTLVNTNNMVANGLADAFEKFTGNRPAYDDMVRLSGMPLRDQMMLFGLPEEGVDERVAYAITCYEKYHATNTLFQPTVDALLRAHDAGMKIALVTSRNAHECEELVNQFPVFKHVETIVCSTDVAQGKPHPESAFRACDRLNIPPSDAFFVGDSIYDLGCAHAAGMPCISVLYGAGTRDVLEPMSPELLIETPEDVLATVTEILKSCEKEKTLTPTSRP